MELENQIPKIRVCIRKRPLNRKEQSNTEKDVVEVKVPDEVFVREQKHFKKIEVGFNKVCRRTLFQIRFSI